MICLGVNVHNCDQNDAAHSKNIIYITHTLSHSLFSLASLSLSVSLSPLFSHSLAHSRSLARSHALTALSLSHFTFRSGSYRHRPFYEPKGNFLIYFLVCRRVHVYSAHIFVSVGASVIQRHFHCALHCSQSTLNLSGRT